MGIQPNLSRLRILGLGAALALAALPLSPSTLGQQSMGSGSATGQEHEPVFDSQRRPITAGGFVKEGPLLFEDTASKAGLYKFRHVSGGQEKSTILEAIGSGVALFDYDNDGWLDIYLVNGSFWAAEEGAAGKPRAALFHNNHDGTFTDVTARAGVANERWGVGAVAADYDNDGYDDLFVSNYGKSRLYHNNRNGTFTDVAEKAGVTFDGWATGATWGDFDGDGFVDLFVPGYVHFLKPGAGTTPAQQKDSYCSFRGVATMCGPRGLAGESDKLFRNNGNGTFSDVSVHAGVQDRKGYYGLTSLFIDVNGDGKLDLLVGNDSTPNYLYLNKGDGTFQDASYESGYALNEGGRETATMGIAAGDYLHQGSVDLYSTTFSDDYKPLYHNDGSGNFTDVAYKLGIAEPSIPFLGWGTAFFDYDNDGWLDLITANGHVYPQVDRNTWGTSYRQRVQLLHSIKGRLEFIPPVEGSALAKVQAARGLAVGDLFNDGQVAVVMNNMDEPPSLFRNVTHTDNHWLDISLKGTGKSNRDAIGAVVLLTANGFTQRADVIAGGSYASSSDRRVHFGLGHARNIDSCVIRWPDGQRQQIAVPAVDQVLYVTEALQRK